jgi:LPPG:FO 2-phospho-L-lactate transferase
MSNRITDLRVVALAGGVGGAKLVVGLDQLLPPGQLTAIVNTGDDFEHFGLKICPDLDTVCYSLAGMADSQHGWGLANETWQVSRSLENLEAPTWFQLGDRDLATHLERTRLLQAGLSLSEVTSHFCQLWGIHSSVLPMSDAPAPTLIETRDDGILGFQEYFVREHFAPEVRTVILNGGRPAEPAADLLPALAEADLVVICPSNPWVSIDPILNVSGVRPLLNSKPVIAVSPIIQGQALKGPAAKLFKELGIEPSARAVREHYGDLLNAFMMDQLDRSASENDTSKGIINCYTNTIMKTEEDKRQLARVVLELGLRLG